MYTCYTINSFLVLLSEQFFFFCLVCHLKKKKKDGTSNSCKTHAARQDSMVMLGASTHFIWNFQLGERGAFGAQASLYQLILYIQTYLFTLARAPSYSIVQCLLQVGVKVGGPMSEHACTWYKIMHHDFHVINGHSHPRNFPHTLCTVVNFYITRASSSMKSWLHHWL